MATTIQHIELPKKARALDTSGNNNHGQIYSGRGLEFDGVADNLVISTEQVFSGEFSIVTWFNTAGGSSTDHALFGSGEHTDCMRVKQSQETLELRMDVGGDGSIMNFVFTGSFNLNTWYRMVFTRDSSNNIRCFLNGVESVTGALVEASNLKIENIGRGYSGWPYIGLVSDFQLWDTAWTQTDITYDYLNPESLALNGGGTALTESNLKLWYPMQDGHRGQQSYILDGANSGLGDDLVSEGDFSGADDGDPWTTGTGWSIEDGKAVCDGTNGTYSSMQQSSLTSVGKVYKTTFTVEAVSGAIELKGSGVYTRVDTLGVGTHTFYFTADATYFRFLAHAGATVTLDNVSVKAINDKNHATTVFHGDEELTNGDFASDLTGWTGYGTTSATGGVATIGATSNSGIYQTILTEGVTYTVTVNVTSYDGTGTAQFTNGNGNNLYTITETGIQTFIFTSVISSGQMILRGMSNALFSVSSVSVKEVGVASGWTDADQQLHIPQTALQSYNELAWFDGVADYVDINPSTAIWNGSDGEWNSVSCWVNETGLDSGIFYWDLGFKPGLYVKISGSNHTIGYNTGNGEQFGITIASTNIINKWNHWVMNWKRNSNDDDTAISGSDVELFLNGVKQTLSYVSGSNSNSCDTSTTRDINLMSVGSNYFTNGTITEVSAWKDQLSDAEVLELFNDGKALDALTHSNANLSAYWRNNGLSTWTNLVNPGTNDGTPTSVTETILIPQGVDSSRDNQGFIMNKQKDTSCLNLTEGSDEAYVVVKNNPTIQFGSGGSVGFWMKPKGTPPGTGYCILNNGSGNSRNPRITLQSNLKINFFWEIADGTNKDTDATSAVTEGEWTYVVCTWDGTTNKIYLNDALDKSEAESGTPDTDTGDLYIGKDQTGSDDKFKGYLDGITFYSDVLSLEEVKRNYNATKGSHRN